MNSYSLIGVDPTQITHNGVIDGQKPQIGVGPTLAIAEPVVGAGRADFGSIAAPLTHGGLFAFDRKSVIVEDLIGTPIIVSPSLVAGRPLPGVPFMLLPDEWLQFTGGTAVGVVVRLNAQRIL